MVLLSAHCRIPVHVRVDCVVQSKALAASEACHMVMTASISVNRTTRLGENAGQDTEGAA